MAAYVVAIINIKDAKRYENEYVQGVRPLMAKYGGRSLMASDSPDLKEGDWPPGRLIVIEFPDKAAAEAWYADPAYRPLLELRGSISDSLLAIVEGR